MSLWILDTDHLTLWQNEHPLLKQRVDRVNREEIASLNVHVVRGGRKCRCRDVFSRQHDR